MLMIQILMLKLLFMIYSGFILSLKQTKKDKKKKKLYESRNNLSLALGSSSLYPSL